MIPEKADLSMKTNVITSLLNSTLKSGPSTISTESKTLWLKIKLVSKCTQKVCETGPGHHPLISQDTI